MKVIIIILLTLTIISCKKVAVVKTNYEKQTSSNSDNNDLKIIDKNINCPFDSLQLQTSEYEGSKFFSENTMRGDGVIQISINDQIEILNLDKTVFGSISPQKTNGELNSYVINLPKNIIAREIIPDLEFQVFDFDAEVPNDNADFITIYINKQKKLISRKKVKYNFLSWDKYVKSAFIQFNSEQDKYWYKAIKINADSMFIKSVPKTDCDYIEEYKDISKWIKWKNGNCKLIKLNFCY